MSFGPAVGCWVLTISLLLRVRGARGRARTRLLLVAGSAAAGGVYRAALAALPAQPAQASDAAGLAGLTVVAGVTITVGLGTAGLVAAADAGSGWRTWLRRVLDGAVMAGAAFMAGWVFLGRSEEGWRAGTGMLGVLWASEVVFLGFLLALRRLVRADQQATVWAAIVGVSFLVIGDSLPLSTGGPGGDEAMSFRPPDLFVTAGLLIVAVGPWVPGGASVLVAGRPALRSGMEGAAAFVPLTVCTVTALGYVLAPSAGDPVPLLVGAVALLGLWARQICLPSEVQARDD
ncbi:hypothetical protein [Streptomyces stelliscabiei]|uniref:hypothetical protein n=1 Tax=Streptomyces stelliscabiei TaxID=146820 RepID=UPI0029BC72D0|nr:hypothetical protein [Streptomyces stelliscabiei]MDX2550535.1 hypothetical protein [Streptomyces stelliscabiei]MDX2610233.1 hypothetical protein [Streptomyces stelliscabiei]MDX2659792.1 hypothetical protein [Streptomyces stelliscabiei]MDX2711515.1 hypothetical protein [Streptomyces stelliscabiei]MDX2786938.1 hypothetical protein [Streptomyces stelliscabiei]